MRTDWIDQEKHFDAYDRAKAEGYADEWLRAVNTAELAGLKKADLGTLPPWAQDLLREWYGPRQPVAMPKAA